MLTIRNGLGVTIGDGFAMSNDVLRSLVLDYQGPIGQSAFEGCRGLTNLTIGTGVTKIGKYAFCGCLDLKRVVLSPGVECSEAFPKTCRVIPLIRVVLTGKSEKCAYDGKPHSFGYAAAADFPSVYDVENGVCFMGTASGVNVGAYELSLTTNMFSNVNEDCIVEFSVAQGEKSTLTILPAEVSQDGNEPWGGDGPRPYVEGEGVHSLYSTESTYDGFGHTIDVETLSGIKLVGGDVPQISYALTSNGVYQTEPIYFTNSCFTSIWYRVESPNHKPYIHEAGISILPRPVCVVSKSAQKVYDGTPLTAGFDIGGSGFVAGECEVTAVGAQTAVGTSNNTIVLSWAVGALLTNYEISKQEGTLTVLPRKVTLTSGTASKNCDGTALTCESVSVSGDGFVGDEGVLVNYADKRIWPGTSQNAFDYSFKTGTIGSNYQITIAFGNLTVTATGTVVVDGSITTIPVEAFKGCSELTAVVLSENVTSIGANAFAGCTKLKRITFPANMEIRRSRLYDWGLTDDFIAGYRAGDFIVINTTVLEYVGNKLVTSLTIPSGTTVIDDDALKGLDNLAAVTFAGTERVLGAQAFKDGVSLEAVDLPVTLEEIGTGAFENCTWMNRASVDGGTAFPENLRRVGARAFYNCMELTSVVLPEGVRDVGDAAFYNCRGLISASLPHSLTNIGGMAFGKCAKLTGITTPTGLKTLAKIFPDGFSKVSSVTVPDGETDIIDGMFKDCEGVMRFAIPASVTNVGRSAFENCASLPSLALPDDIVGIGSAAFKDCSALSVVSLPKNLMAIADGLFECCTSLESIIVPASVTVLGSNIFKESAVTEVKFLGNAPDYRNLTYDGTGNLTSYIVRGSTGWDYAETGIHTSRQKPDSWIEKAIEYWSPNIFEVTFDGNGGKPETYVAEQITDTTYSLPKVNPTRDGYVFKGWWTEPVAGGEVTANTICVANRAHTLYAHWEAGATVEVSFNPCGGTVTPDVRSYVSGTTYGEFPVPTKRGYRFQGWFTAAERGEKVNEADRVPSVAMTLYAQWKPIVYAVEFHANNGTVKTASQDFTFGEAAALRVNDFTWGEHNFIGWAKSPGGAVEFADKDVVLNLSELDAADGGVVCLYARWSGASYAVRFDANGGTGHMDNETFMTGLAQAIDSNRYERVGYDFSGWARTPTGDVAYGDREVIRDIVESGTVVLYAVWTAVSSERITVRFDPGEGATSELASKEYEVGLKYGTLPGATLKGYAMVGWFTEREGGVLAGATSNVTAHTTLYAHWSPIKYRVSFDGNGGAGNMPLQTFTYDQEQALDRCTFVKGGYDFVGWSNLAAGDVIYADGQPVKNLTATPNLTVPLYAVWQKTSGGPVDPPDVPEPPIVEPVVTNTIAYVNLQGAANTNVTMFTTNDLPLVLGPVDREGYTFLGWTPNDGVIPAGTMTNVTFAANWAIVETPAAAYGPWGEADAVKNPDKLGPTMLTDMVVSVDGRPAAEGDVVAVFRGDTGMLCGLGKVMDDSRTLTVVCYAPKGVMLSFKVWLAESGIEEPVVVKCDKASMLVAPDSGAFYSGHKISCASSYAPSLSSSAIAGIAVGSAAVVGVAGHFIGRAVSESIGKKKGNPTYKQFKAMKLVVPELDARGFTYKNKLVYHPAKGTVTGKVVLTVQKGNGTKKIRAKAKGTLKDGVITGTLDAKGLGPLDFTVK